MNKVYFIVHNDSYIAKSYLTNELNLLNLIEYDFIDLNTLINKISQLDFFNEPKNYFINQLELQKKEEEFFIDFIKNYSLNNNLYFYINETNKKLINFISDNFKDNFLTIDKFNETYKFKLLKKFFLNELKVSNIDESNLFEILEWLPNEFSSFINEIKKFKLLDTSSINLDNIKQVIYKDDEVNLFNLCESILSKKYEIVFEILNSNEEDEFLLKVIALLANYLFKLISYKLLTKTNKESLNNIFKNPWEIKKIQNIQKLYNISNLIYMNNDLLDLDFKFKTYQIKDLKNHFKFIILNWKDQQ
ncbi:MAG: hypothetical protein IIT78_03670 [Mycoplasmataceae bacterium]|nr:hypothetical protein [Mycoplasmataceae bacterium]